MNDLLLKGQDSASLWRRNPVFLHLLGLSPLLAVSTLTASAIGLAVLTGLALLTSNLLLHWLADYIRGTWRFFWTLMILAAITTLLALYCRHFHPALFAELGIYLPLIACNLALLLQLESQQGQTSLAARLAHCLRLLAGYSLALVLFAALREGLGGGSILSGLEILIPGSAVERPETDSGPLADIVALPGSAFILLGLLVAVYNWLERFIAPATSRQQEEIQPAPRARVTEKLNS